MIEKGWGGTVNELLKASNRTHVGKGIGISRFQSMPKSGNHEIR
jgi:hypothetical protein